MNISKEKLKLASEYGETAKRETVSKIPGRNRAERRKNAKKIRRERKAGVSRGK